MSESVRIHEGNIRILLNVFVKIENIIMELSMDISNYLISIFGFADGRKCERIFPQRGNPFDDNSAGVR